MISRCCRCLDFLPVGIVVASFVSLQGCVVAPGQNPVVNHLKATGKSTVEAVAPLFDVHGRSVSVEGREIEESLARQRSLLE